MAKATKSLGPQTAPGNRVDVTYLTLEEATAALVTLINGRPTIPSLEEIRAIVARHRAESPAARKEKEADRQLVAFGATFDELTAKLRQFEETEEDSDAIPEAVDLETSAERVAKHMTELPATSAAGRRVKARAMLHWNQHIQCILDRDPATLCMGDIVLASLIRDLLCEAPMTRVRKNQPRAAESAAAHPTRRRPGGGHVVAAVQRRRQLLR